MVLVLLASCVSAFPLSGGNGIVNALVFGVTSESDESNTQFYIDMCVTDIATPAYPGNNYFVELVDSEDRIHETSSSGANFGGYGHIYGNLVRDTLAFTVPKDAIIKRLKITPNQATKSDPFSIDWNGVPEISSDGVIMKFYSGQRISPKYYDGQYQWVFDIKLTNTGNTTLTFSTKDFYFEDNNDWIYGADKDAREIKLSPNETLRFPITFTGIGEFSRATKIIFRDENVSMDIGAWV